MKILMIGWELPPFNSGGLGTVCYDLAKALSKKGEEVKFILPYKCNINVDFMKILFPESSLEINEKNCNDFLDTYKSFSKEELKKKIFLSDEGLNLIEKVKKYAFQVKQIAMKEDFDVIHVHDWLTIDSGIEAKKVSGKKLIMHVHATEFDRSGGNINKNSPIFFIEKYGMQQADKIIAVSNIIKKIIIENYDIPSEKISVVHNAIGEFSGKMYESSSLKKKEKIVLFMGRVTIQKGPEFFVYAAKKVLERMHNILFLFIGSGDMREEIIKKVSDLGIADKFLFSPFARGEDVNKAYQMADLYIMSSVSEPFGLMPLESLQNNTPVIVTKQTGVSEVLNHCLKVDFWDIDEMANKIIAVLKYPELQQCLKENGNLEVKGISWDKPIEKIIKVYKEAQ